MKKNEEKKGEEKHENKFLLRPKNHDMNHRLIFSSYSNHFYQFVCRCLSMLNQSRKMSNNNKKRKSERCIRRVDNEIQMVAMASLISLSLIQYTTMF